MIMMIIYTDKTFTTTGNVYTSCDEDTIPQYVENYVGQTDNPELIAKLVEYYPNYEVVFENREIVDIIPDLNSLKETKISQLSEDCQNTIFSGTDYNNHHYSMKLDDQLNMGVLSNMLINGATSVPYHADDEVCRMYSATEFNAMFTTCMNFKVYNQSYFNQLKDMVKNFSTEIEVANAYYGMPLDEEHMENLNNLLGSVS